MVLVKKYSDQWNRVEGPEIYLHKHSQLIDNGEKAIQWRKNSLSTKGSDKTGYPHTKSESHQVFQPFIIIYSKWFTDLSLNSKL